MDIIITLILLNIELGLEGQTTMQKKNSAAQKKKKNEQY